MVFTSATSSSLLGIKAIFDQFYSASGLDVSFGKSELFCCGVSLDVQNQLAATFGLRKGTLPVRYLGIPLSCKKPSVTDC